MGKNSSKEEVLKKVNEKPVTWKHGRNKWIGYLIRHSTYLVTVIQGKLEVKKYRGRPRKQFREQVTESVVA